MTSDRFLYEQTVSPEAKNQQRKDITLLDKHRTNTDVPKLKAAKKNEPVAKADIEKFLIFLNSVALSSHRME